MKHHAKDTIIQLLPFFANNSITFYQEHIYKRLNLLDGTGIVNFAMLGISVKDKMPSCIGQFLLFQHTKSSMFLQQFLSLYLFVLLQVMFFPSCPFLSMNLGRIKNSRWHYYYILSCLLMLNCGLLAHIRLSSTHPQTDNKRNELQNIQSRQYYMSNLH